MDSQPRRSARLSQLHQQQSSTTSFSSVSPLSSVSTSSYPSPAQDFAQQQDQLRLQLHTQYLSAPQQVNAPLPSPSTNDLNPFFSSLQPQANAFQMSQQSQQAATQSHHQHGRAGSDKSNPHQALEHHNSFSSQQHPNMQTGNNSSQLPPDFLAEAARRAQIACLMRDMGDVTL